MKKKILLLTHCFAPYTYPEAYLNAKRFGDMEDYEVDVVSIKAFLPWVKEDTKFFQQIKQRFNSITHLTPPGFYKKLPFHRLESIFSLPDPFIYLNYLYKIHFKKANYDFSKYEVIVTWSMYHSIHLLGKYLKEKANCKWVAHFSDPWTSNPYLKERKLISTINKKLEQRVFNKADLLTFTSEATIEQALCEYDKKIQQKAHIMPHSFDEDLYNISKAKELPLKSKNDLITESDTPAILVSYIGSFYKERNPQKLLEAISQIKATNPSILDNVLFEFIGNKEQEYAVSENITENVAFKNPVDYISSLKHMLDANLLLVIDAPFAESPFLPSKLIDYIGANRPIFGITPKGTSQKLIEEMGFLTANPKSPEEIAEKLTQMIELVRKGEATYIPAEIRNRYSAQTIAKQFTSLLSKID